MGRAGLGNGGGVGVGVGVGADVGVTVGASHCTIEDEVLLSHMDSAALLRCSIRCGRKRSGQHKRRRPLWVFGAVVGVTIAQSLQLRIALHSVPPCSL